MYPFHAWNTLEANPLIYMKQRPNKTRKKNWMCDLLYLRLVGMCMWITTIKYNFWEQFYSGIDGKKNNPHFFLSQKDPWVSESLRSQSTVKLWLQNGYCLGFPALWLADCAVEAQPCNAAHAGLGIISIHFLWKSLLLSPDLNCFLFLLNCYSI